jgi:enoyl-CoA hydratase/carnithine racemase
MGSTVKLKKHPPSGTIILNRPDKCNALSRAMIADVQQALGDFHLERQVRAVIVTGAGHAFCSGADLAEMRDHSEDEGSLAQWHQDAVEYKQLIELMLRFPKPIIAAVNGPAVAGGAGLVLASDIALATPQASFGFPEARRGLVAGIVAPLLVFRIGGGFAAKLLLSAELASAEQAERVQLYHELVAEDKIWARAHEMAQLCARAAPESLQLTKRMINETIGEHLGTLLTAGAAATATARTTEAAAEGLAAFLEKREPEWP